MSLRVGIEAPIESQGLQKTLNESVHFKINSSWQREMKKTLFILTLTLGAINCHLTIILI